MCVCVCVVTAVSLVMQVMDHHIIVEVANPPSFHLIYGSSDLMVTVHVMPCHAMPGDVVPFTWQSSAHSPQVCSPALLEYTVTLFYPLLPHLTVG